MQLKSIELAHSGLSYFGYSFKHFIAFDPLVIAYAYRCGVNKGYPGASSQTARFKEDGHRHQHALAEFDESIVGDGSGEFGLHVLL